MDMYINQRQGKAAAWSTECDRSRPKGRQAEKRRGRHTAEVFEMCSIAESSTLIYRTLRDDFSKIARMGQCARHIITQ